MADVNSNININFNTAAALAQLRSLQAGLSKFHQSLAEGNLAAANAQKGLNAQLLQSVGATGKFSASQVKVAGSTLAFTAALEKNKLSLREYFRYTMAAATANTRVLGRAFAQEREIINRARRDRVKALQAQYIQMNKANAGFMDAIKIMPKSLAMASGKFTELGTRIQYAAQRQQFLNQLLKQGSTQLLNFGKNTQWAGRQLMVGLTMPLALFGGMAAKTFRDLEKEIVKFRRVYGDAFTNDAETNLAVENIRNLANEYTKYGVAVTKTMEMAATAAAAGFTGGALNAQVETATKLAVLGQIEQQQALETTISLQSAFGISSEELAKKIDFLNAVENQTLLSIEDLTIAIPKAAPVVKQLGGSVEDLAFFLTAMKEGGINASEGANALKSGLASLINPSDKASKMLAGLGINIKGIVEGNQGDIKATVIGFADALDTLDPLNRARAIEQMFGKFQFSRLSTLFQNVTKDGTQASRALSLAGSSVEELAILSEREMKKIEDSVGVKFQAAVEQFKQDIMPLGKIFLEALTPVVKFFGNLFEKFNGLSDNTKKIIAVLVGVVAGLGPVVLMTFGLLMNLVANGIKLFAKLRGGIARLNGQTTVLGAGFNYMTQEQIENAASSQQLHQTHTRLIEVFNVEANSVNALASSYNSLSTQMRAMASANPALFAGGMGGAKRAVSKLPPVRKFRDGILSVPGPKGAGDIQPAMLAPGEAVIPAKTTEKYKGLISAIFKDQVPGFMAGRVPKVVAKVKGAKSEPLVIPHAERQSGAVFLGMPVPAAKAAQSREILDRISSTVKSGRFGSVPPTDFGTLLQPFSGRSFPARGVGGVYRKPNGELVVVKPTIDERTALAEVRATQIAREVHGLVSPKQTIRTMIDPTDPARQRKFIVVESPYDPRIAAMGGTFSKSDMIKQLVASTLRGDKDLARGNLSGNVLADVGTAGVFDRASGFRDFAKAMPSMEQQAVVNLLGVKGGAKKFFAQETSAIAAGMTPAQYDAAIKAEISRSIPRLEKVLKSWDLDPTEKIVYGDMLKRLRAGQKTDWSKLQPIHARAGQGIEKFDEGIIPGVPSSVTREQLNRYALASAEDSQSRSADLRRSVESEFRKRLETIDPERARIIKAAWEGGKAPVPPSMKERRFAPRQTAFLNEISKMVPINVDGVTKYIHPKDMDAFKADPDGRAKFARTKSQVIDNLLYRMGVAPDASGRFVAGGKFSGSRFASLSALTKSLTSTGKESGGGLSNVSKIVKPFAKQEIEDYNKRVGDPLKTKTGRAMLAAGYSPDDVRSLLRENLSHIRQEVTGSTSGAKKMKTGQALYDARILNNYMNAKSRSLNILDDLNKNNILGLSEIEKSEYRKAAEFMAKGNHPTNAQERALLAKAVELDQRVINAQANGTLKNVSARFLPADLRTPKILQTLLSDSAFQPGRLLNLAATDPSQVLVKPGEFLFDKNARTLTELTTKNTGPKPPGTQASTGKRSDRRTSTEGPGRTTVTKAQADRLAASGGVRVIRGRDAGDPYAKLSPVERLKFERFKQKRPDLSESQLQDILRRKLKHERDIAKAKEKEAAAARKAARRAELLPKQQADETKRQTAEARKRYLAEQRRMELNRQQALNYDAAVKEGQRRELQAIKAKQKEATRNRRMLRQEKVGRVSGGAAMALGTAGMGLMMAGQQGAGMAVMGASAVAGMAPMLTNPYIAAGVAITAAAAGLWMLERQSNKTAKAQSQFVDATSATTGKMKAIGEMNSKIGASEIYAEKRSKGAADRYTTGFDRGKQQYGVTFLEGKVGKDIMSGFTKSMASGTDTAAQQMALQLAGYISDGVMSAEQAHSVAAQIGINLNNQSLTAQISGQLLELVGPGGEDLLKNPLEVRIRLVEEQKGVGTVLKNELETSMSGMNFSADNILSETSKIFSPFILTSLARGASSIFGEQVDLGFVNYSAKEMFGETKGEAQASAGAASGVQSLEFSQAQIDSLNTQYDKDKKILETKMAATKDAAKRKEIEDQISELETRRLDGVTQLRQGNSDILAQQIELFQVAQKRGAVENSFFDSLKEQVRLKAEETGQGDFADAFLKSSADLESKVLEVKIDTIVGSGMMPVATATTLLSMFAGDEDGLETFIDVTTQLQDPGQVTQLINSLGGIEGTVGKELLLEIGSANPEEANKLMSTIALMQEMAGKEINFQAFFKEEGAIDKLKTLKDELEEVEKLEGPITREVITSLEQNKEAGMPDMSGLLDLWHQWEGLPDEVKKTVVQEYLTILSTISDAQVDTYIAEEAQAAGGTFGGEVARYYSDPKNRAEVEARAAAKIVMQRQKQMEALKKLGLLGDSGGGGKKDNPLAFLDSLAMGLKQVRDGAFNALTPLESLLAVFTNKKTQKDAFNLFDGIQNRLLKLNVGEDLRGAIESMSAEDFDKIAKLEGKKALFTFAKGKPKSKATITGLTETGKAVDQGYKEKALGNFNLKNEETIKNIQEQTKAYNILIGSGLTASQALEVVSSQGQAAAIASGAISTSDPDWQKYIKNIRTANTDLERQAVLNKILRENEEFEIYKDMPKLASQMKDLGYGTDQIDKVLGDPQLAKILMDDLKDGKLDAADIAENLDNIEAKKLIDIQVQLNKGNLKEGAELGRQIVDEMFAAYEGLIRTGEEANKIIANDRLISGYEADLEPFTKKIQGLTEDVNDLNRQLEMNPLFGDRAIQALEDENSAYSNDLTIISNAAEEVNKKYDEQAEALSKVQEINSEILNQQKQQLDLADALTSGDISAAARAVQEMRAASAAKFASAQSDALQRARENELGSLTARPGGLTQEQITKKQYENSQKIYAMEKDPRRLAILKEIQGKQDEIYNIEENDVERIQAKIDARVEDNRELQRSIDKQLAAITVYGKTRGAWDTVNAGIDYHAAAMLTLNNPDALAGLVEAAGRVDAVWTKINGQMDAYKKNMPDSVKTSLGLIKTGETQSEDDKAKIAKEREDKQEEDRKLAVLSLALRKLTVGVTLTDEEKALVAASQPKNKRRVNSGAFQTLASGGKVKGPGTSTSDSIPAMLSNGEYVINADSVNKYGVSTFDSLNAQRLRTGGLVGNRQGANASATDRLVPGTGVYNGSTFVPPKYTTDPVEKPAPTGNDYKSYVGGDGLNRNGQRAGWRTIFEKKNWQKTADFFAIPQIYRTGYDFVKYGANPMGMMLARATGQEMKSSLTDNFVAGLSLIPVPVAKLAKPLVNGVSRLVPRGAKDFLLNQGIDIFSKISARVNKPAASAATPAPAGKPKVGMPANYKMDYDPSGSLHRITVRDGDEVAGYLTWDKTTGVVENLQVYPAHRSKNIGTTMYQHAQTIAPITHSPFRTPAGDAWAYTQGDPVPPLNDSWLPGDWSGPLLDAAQARAAARAAADAAKAAALAPKPRSPLLTSVGRSAKALPAIAKDLFGSAIWKTFGNIDAVKPMLYKMEKLIGRRPITIPGSSPFGRGFKFATTRGDSYSDYLASLKPPPAIPGAPARPDDWEWSAPTVTPMEQLGETAGLLYKKIVDPFIANIANPVGNKYQSLRASVANKLGQTKEGFDFYKQYLMPRLADLNPKTLISNFLYRYTPYGSYVAKRITAQGSSWRDAVMDSSAGPELFASLRDLAKMAFFHGGKIGDQPINRSTPGVVGQPTESFLGIKDGIFDNLYDFDLFTTGSPGMAAIYSKTKNNGAWTDQLGDVFQMFFPKLDSPSTWDLRGGQPSLWSQNKRAYSVLEAALARTMGLAEARLTLLGERVPGVAKAALGQPRDWWFNSANLRLLFTKLGPKGFTSAIDTIVHEGGRNTGSASHPVVATLAPEKIVEGFSKILDGTDLKFFDQLSMKGIDFRQVTSEVEKTLTEIVERAAEQKSNIGRVLPFLGEGHVRTKPKGKGQPLALSRGGLVPNYFAAGGYAIGTDTVPAMLTPGEYVLRKDAVKKYGVENLDTMNLGYYHKGGPVGHRHGRNAPATPATPEKSKGFFGRMASFFGKGDRDPSNGGPTNNSWLDRYARSRTETDKETQALLDKSPLTSWMGADVLGLTGFLKMITGQATTADKFNGIFFPLNFLGIGKVAGEGTKAAAPVAKQTSGFLSKLGPMFSKSIAAPVSRVSNSIFGSIKAAGSKVVKPIKELFLPAANPNFNIKNSFLEGLKRGAPRMGFAQDPAAIKAINKKMEPLVAKLNAAGYVQNSPGGTFMLKGTHSIPYSPANAIEEGHPLFDTMVAISKLEVELMGKSTKSAKNFGYYASVAGSLVKKAKDKAVEKFPGLVKLLSSATASKLPGQIRQKELNIGKLLLSDDPLGVGTGVNKTFRATLDGVAGFYKTGIDFAEVQREVFGSIFARAANLIAPVNIPVVGKNKFEANGIFSPDVAAQGAQTLKALKTQAGYASGPFDRLSDPAMAISSGYRSAIMLAMRFVDDHDGNLTINPETLQPGLIDFGRILDFQPFVPNIDSFVSEMLKPFYTYGDASDAWKNPQLTSAYFSGIDKGINFLQTLKEKDIVEMLEAAGYVGEELAKHTNLIMQSIRTTSPAATKAAADMKIRQQMQGVMPAPYAQNAWPTPPNAAQNAASAEDWLRGLADAKTPTNPLKPLALGLFGASTGAAGLLLADPDLSSLKITTQPPKPKSSGGSGRGSMLALSRGGLVPSYFAAGGYAIGTDTVPAMLTPGEFVMSKYAVDKYGVDNMKSINSGSSVGDSVYNYNLNLNVKSDANPDEIARAVMVQIKSIDAQRIRGARI